MSTLPSDNTTTAVDKGKGRASPNPPESDLTERTPLLASQSSVFQDDVREIRRESARDRRRLCSKLTRVFLASLCATILLLIVFVIIAYSYAARASAISPEEILDRVFVLGALDRVDVLNVTGDGGMWLEMEGSMGLDAGALIGVNKEVDDGYWIQAWKAMGRWGVHHIDEVSIDLSTIHLGSEDDSTLAEVDVPTLVLPLVTNPPPGTSWLTTLSMPIFVRPTENGTVLANFLRDAWTRGFVTVQANLRTAAVHGGGLHDTSWRRRIKFTRSSIDTMIHMKVPSLPGFPPPGHKSPFPDVSKLVTLQSYGVYFESDRLVVHAQATVVNPLPETFTLAAPSLPFTVSVSPMNSSGPVIPVASTHNEAFALTHPNITASVSGYVLPLSASSLPTLSDFLSRYLSSKSNTIQVSTPIFPGLTFDVIVPGPHPRPQVLRNVTIHNMSIHPTVGSMFVASGTIFAQLVLPKGVDIEAEVYRVFPDVLVFDGEVPDDAGTVMQEDLRHVDETPSFPPPPDPLPERAFAHIRPEDWVPSVSCPAPRGPDEGASYYVTGTIHNVPLQVLPGREKIFTDFVTKVVFGGKHGALAGILGTTAAAVDVRGLRVGGGSEVELTGLPFRGRVRVGNRFWGGR